MLLHQLLVRSFARLQLPLHSGQQRFHLQILPIHLIDMPLGSIEFLLPLNLPLRQNLSLL